jgi:cyanoexosortase A
MMELLRALFIDQQNKKLKISLFCLCILAIIHLYLDIYLDKQSHLILSSLLWGVIFLLQWDNRNNFKGNEDKISQFGGYLLVTALLMVTVVRPGEKLVGFFPLIAFLGWLLIFVGFPNPRAYLKEIAILIVFGLPKLVSESAFGLAPLTAHAATYILWYLGQPVFLQGVQINVPNGSVEVVPACSGVSLIMHMISVSIMVLSLSPVRDPSHRVILPLIAVCLGFIMNSLRVALLALLSPPQFSKLFHYWHSTNGASVIVLLTLSIYSFIYFYISKPLDQKS